MSFLTCNNCFSVDAGTAESVKIHKDIDHSRKIRLRVDSRMQCLRMEHYFFGTTVRVAGIFLVFWEPEA